MREERSYQALLRHYCRNSGGESCGLVQNLSLHLRRFACGDSTQGVTLKPDVERMVNEITSIAEELGGEPALGRPVANAKSTIGYLAHQFVPFSVGNMQESSLRNQNNKAESFACILPTPRWAGRSAAENLAFDYFKGTQASAGQDEWSLEHKTSFIQLRNQVAQGKVTDEQIGQAIESGKLNPRLVKYLYQTVNKPNLQTWTERLTSPQQVWNVWSAATNAEKQTLFPSVVKKMASETSGDEQQGYLKELQYWADMHPQ
jgi:hypothetical protein